MTSRAREWIRTFADPATLSDLRAAATDCQAQICNHDPPDCDCPENRMLPSEFVDWLERELHVEGQRPTRFEPGHRPRRKRHEQLTLAIAG